VLEQTESQTTKRLSVVVEGDYLRRARLGQVDQVDIFPRQDLRARKGRARTDSKSDNVPGAELAAPAPDRVSFLAAQNRRHIDLFEPESFHFDAFISMLRLHGPERAR